MNRLQKAQNQTSEAQQGRGSMLQPSLRTSDSCGDEDCTKAGASLNRRDTARRQKKYENQHAIWRRLQTSKWPTSVSGIPNQRPHRCGFSGLEARLEAHQLLVQRHSSLELLSHSP